MSNDPIKNGDDEFSQAIQRRLKRAAHRLPVEESRGRREQLWTSLEQLHAPVTNRRSQRTVWVGRRVELGMALTAMLLMSLVVTSEYFSFDTRGNRLAELSDNALSHQRNAEAGSPWQTRSLRDAHATVAGTEGGQAATQTTAEPRACDWLAVELQSILKPSRIDWTGVKQAMMWPGHVNEPVQTVHQPSGESRNGGDDDLSLSIVSAGVDHVAFEVGDRPLVELAVSLLGR